MSVLIKGMEMPKDGELLCINIYPDGKVSINLDLKCKQVATAVPVPPHGRLIDADALLNKHFGKMYFEKVMTATKEEMDIALTNIPLVINSVPTIIPAEEEKEPWHIWRLL